MITGGAAVVNGRLYIGVSSLEEGTAVIPTYPCCTFRGSVVSLDTGTGRQIWKTFTIPDEPRPTTKNDRGTQLYGPSGAGVWSAPLLDPDRNRVYVGTGNNYSESSGTRKRRHRRVRDGLRPHGVDPADR